MGIERTYDDVITRYILNESTPEEVKFLTEWMDMDEKNRAYVASFQQTLQLIAIRRAVDEVDVEQEWVRLQQEVKVKNDTAAEVYEYQENEWEAHTLTPERSRVSRYRWALSGLAVAAGIALLIGFARWWWGAPADRKMVATQTGSANKETKIDSLMAVVQHEVNTSGKAKKFQLPDGSAVVLADSSELTYQEPIDKNRRSVFLSGIATFTVAKKQSKPFTVFTEDIATTALGTRFTLDTKENKEFIYVKLFQGKVMVKPVVVHAGWNKALYLKPGEELIYNKRTKSATVAHLWEQNKTAKTAEDLLPENPLVPNNKESWFMFNNQPLSEVLDALADMYGREIQYSRRDLKNMYFIGTYEKADSLENILNIITQLNDLNLIKQGNIYKIEKRRQ